MSDEVSRQMAAQEEFDDAVDKALGSALSDKPVVEGDIRILIAAFEKLVAGVNRVHDRLDGGFQAGAKYHAELKVESEKLFADIYKTEKIR